MNNVNLIGRLTKAPELKQTASNTNVLTGTLAVKRTFKNQNGNVKQILLILLLGDKLRK